MSSLMHGNHHTHRNLRIFLSLAFFFCVLPYVMIVRNVLSGASLIAVILGSAILQATAQLFFAFRMGKEPKPYWNVQMFISMAVVTILIVLGSLWIMANLDYNVMPGM